MNNTALHDAAAIVGRILMSLLFLTSGFGKITGFAGTVAYTASKGLPMAEVLIALSIVIELGCALMLIIGWQARWAAALLFLWLIPVTIAFHNPAGLPADQAQNQMIHMMKNIAIMGGMLMVFALGPGGFSLDRRRGAA